MSQNQHLFVADQSSEIAQTARLVLSVLTTKATVCGRQSEPVSLCIEALMQRLFQASISKDPSRISAVLEAFHTQGHNANAIAFDAIPAVARQLGTAWLNDEISFTDVTIGCARLQSTLHQLPEPIFEHQGAYNGLRRDCLVLVPKGAQHCLGAIVLAKELRQAGQRVTLKLDATRAAILTQAKTNQFDVVMISASQSESIETLRDLTELCRTSWPDSKIVLGGSIQNIDADLKTKTNADCVTNFWQEALDQCI